MSGLEVLGAVASATNLLTLCDLVADAVNGIVQFCKREKAIGELQDRLRILRSVIKQVKEIATDQLVSGTTLKDALSRARLPLEQLLQLIMTRILRQVDGTGSARAGRRAWIQNRRKIVRLELKLEEGCKALSLVLNAETLSLTLRANTQLKSLTRQFIESKGIANSTVDTLRTEEDTQTLSASADVIMRHRFDSPVKSLTDPRNLRQDNVTANMITPHHLLKNIERPLSFRPGLFGLAKGMPSVRGLNIYEIEAPSYFRIRRCSLFHFWETTGRWSRLTLTLTTATVSERQITERQPQDVWNPKSLICILSSSLQSKLEDFFKNKHHLYEQDIHLGVYIDHTPTAGTYIPSLKLPVRRLNPIFDTSAYLWEITMVMRHWDWQNPVCPWYADSQIVHQPIPGRYWFAGKLGRRWVFEHRFASDRKGIEYVWHNLQMLYYLRDSSRVNSLLAILYDDDSQVVTGFLSEPPTKGPLTPTLAVFDRYGSPVSQTRRLKWCRQVVEAVADVHSINRAIGGLYDGPDSGFGIDANDNAVLYRFQAQSSLIVQLPGVVPPEYQKEVNCDAVVASPNTDLYHLGIVLWRIATGTWYPTRPRICQLARCQAKEGSCYRAHADLIELPMDETIPKFLRDIIQACRHEDPHRRLPARTLSRYFEKEMSDELTLIHQATELAPSQFETFDEFSAVYRSENSCDICWIRCSDHHFHCDICLLNDYDICPKCFSEGKHCYDDGHLLIERFEREKGHKYWSSVGSDGSRDSIPF